MSKKTAKQIKTEGYLDKGEFHWKAAREQCYTPGLFTAAIDVEMFRKRGMRRMILNDKAGTRMTVIFDKEYILDTVMRTVVSKLRMVDSGRFNEALYDMFFAELKQYAMSSVDRDNEKQLRAKAEQMHSQFPHKTSDEWYKEMNPQLAPVPVSDIQTDIVTNHSESPTIADVVEQAPQTVTTDDASNDTNTDDDDDDRANTDEPDISESQYQSSNENDDTLLPPASEAVDASPNEVLRKRGRPKNPV